MDTFHLLLNGFSAALSLHNLFYAFIGCILGTVVGILPGLGPVSATAMLIPLTFHLSKDGAIIMLAAIYYGAMYGGTITSVLINVPGDGPGHPPAIDGYQMARQGRAGPMPGPHANTDIPKAIGAAREFELGGAKSDGDIAAYFWQRMVFTQS